MSSFSNTGDVVSAILNDQSLWSGPVDKLPIDRLALSTFVGTNSDHPYASLENLLRFTVIPLPQHLFLYLAHHNLEIITPNEQGSCSSGSQCMYVAMGCHDGYSTLLQYIPPNCQSSSHYHCRTTEDFHNLYGRCRIGLTKQVSDDSEKHYIDLVGSSFTVPTRHIHQMRTYDEPALNFLFMRGLLDPRDTSDHHYVTSPFSF